MKRLLITILTATTLAFAGYASSPAALTPPGYDEVADSAALYDNPLMRTPVGKAFIGLNTESLVLLDRTTRLDMLDYLYLRPETPFVARNAMKGESQLEKCTPDFIRVQLTRVSDFEIRVLPFQKDPQGYIIVTSYTVGDDTSAPDSEVKFYSSDLTPLEGAKLFKEPAVKDFFFIPKGSATKMKELEEMVPFPTVEYSLSADNTDIVARLTVGAYLNQDDYNILKLFLLPQLTYRWTGKQFELVKNK